MMTRNLTVRASGILPSAVCRHHVAVSCPLRLAPSRSISTQSASSQHSGGGGGDSSYGGRTQQGNRSRHMQIGAALGGGALATGLYYYSQSQRRSATCSELALKRMPFTEAFPAAYEELHGMLGDDRISCKEDECEEYGKEVSGYAARSNPQAVVWPESTQEVSKILTICNRYKIPIVPYGSGTSLEGHIIPTRGGITMDMRKMDQVLKVNQDDMDVVVQPGVGWMELNEYMEPYGMFLGVDPGPGASIGGMCGTCCSGTNAVRYGTMKDQVVNLTVVLADGTVLKTGQRARKSSAGYDLARLFVGSEGTLGVVTEATLKMRNIPYQMEIAYVSFDSVKDATNAVIKMLQKGIQMGAIELFDNEMVKAVNNYAGMTLPEKPMLLLKFTGSKASVENDVKEVQNICSQYTKEEYVWCKEAEARDKMWFARKHAFWAAQSMEPERQLMATDVAVPISRLAEMVEATKKDLDESFLFAPIVGHVGDSNFHVVIMFDPDNPKEDEEAHRLNHRMVARAIEMEGTCTGEHGIGLGKKKYLEKELGRPSVELMKTLKQTLDPNNILNPDKVVSIDLSGGDHHHGHHH
ncbi:unnamed protein product [Vitrella brassicaformis CCMP3155]|uniref:D-lactate dehydrogenase (cytochrome) n=1 Tax=Vitrella brassicaformis (strain CCMP3155) TaxID=1169540 RepID=A0A0G4G7S9_VITBC|nr:unnamed protein product [Vitrella brassicaformis CCMP3155]|eukprot:CEM24471.1 unnamed protein product [Vitrella brassicaformis CCMP3155]